MKYTYRLLSAQEHGMEYGLKQVYAVLRGREEIGRIARCDQSTAHGHRTGNGWYLVDGAVINWREGFSRRDDAAVRLDWQRRGWRMVPGALADISHYLTPYGGEVEYADLTPELMTQLQARKSADDAALAARWSA